MATIKQRAQILEQKLSQGVNQKAELLEFELSSSSDLQGVAPRIPPRSAKVIQRAQEIALEDCAVKQDDKSESTNQIGERFLQKVQKSYHSRLEKLAQIGKKLFQEVQKGSYNLLEKLEHAKKFQREERQENNEVSLDELLKQKRSISNSLSRFRANGELSSKGINNLLEIMYNTLSYRLDHPDIKCILNIRNIRKMYNKNSPEFKEVRRIMEEAIYVLNDKLSENLINLKDGLSESLKVIQYDCEVDKEDLCCLYKIIESHKVVFFPKDQKDVKLLLNGLRNGESYNENCNSYRFHRIEEVIGHALHNIECVQAQIENLTKNFFTANGQSKNTPSEKMDTIESIQKCNQYITL